MYRILSRAVYRISQIDDRLVANIQSLEKDMTVIARDEGATEKEL